MAKKAKAKETTETEKVTAEVSMVLVDSSQIKSIGYLITDLSAKKTEYPFSAILTLYIRFNSGGLYCYKNVPLSSYLDLMSADSKGSYFIKEIKGKFDFEKIQ